MVVVQAVILFESDMWVVTPHMEKALKGFHHRAVWWMTSMGPKNKLDGAGVYPPVGATMVTVGLDEIGVYIYCLQNTVAQYIATCPIMESCLAAERRTGKRISWIWW